MNRSNPCQSTTCKNEAKRGNDFCRLHMSPDSASLPLTPTATRQPEPLCVVVTPQADTVLSRLRTLQFENERLREENKRMHQLEADRLRFEQASREAWDKVIELEKVNDELRAENLRLHGRVVQLEIEVKMVTAKLKGLQGDPLLLEVSQVMKRFEDHIVQAISKDASFLLQINFKSDDEAVEKWKQNFRLDSNHLFAFQTILFATLPTLELTQHMLTSGRLR